MLLKKESEEKDLGIIIDNKLKFQNNINKQILKANRMLGWIKRSFKHLDSDMLLCLYKSLVRPQLEYCSTVWTVLFKKEASEIEKIQRRATKMIKNIKDLSYSERLRKLGLPTLEYRRRRADMIETFKIIHGIDKVDKNIFFFFFFFI